METFRWAGWRDEAKKVVGSGMDNAYVGLSCVSSVMPDETISEHLDSLLEEKLRIVIGEKLKPIFVRALNWFTSTI